MNSRIYKKTQKQIFLLVLGGHFVPLKGAPTWRLHTKLYKFGCRHQNGVKYIAGKSFLFILLKEKLDLTLFSVRRSRYFISQTRSLIFNSRLEHDTAASCKKVTRHLACVAGYPLPPTPFDACYAGYTSPIFSPFPRNVSWADCVSKVDNAIHRINLHPLDSS